MKKTLWLAVFLAVLVATVIFTTTTNATKISITLATPKSDLAEGWNFVSFPVFFEKDTPSEVFKSLGSDLQIVWGYDPIEGWKKYVPGGSSNTLGDIRPYRGYWIRMNRPRTLTVEGNVPERMAIDLKTGYNLIGYPSLEVKKINDTIEPIKDKVDIIWYYNTSGDSWKKYVPGSLFNTLQYFEPGKAYWIRIKEPAILYIPKLTGKILDQTIVPSGIYTRGSSVPITYTIKNIDSTTHTFYMGYSVRDEKGNFRDAPYKTVSVSSGATRTETLNWVIPSNASIGKYDAYISLWGNKNGSELKDRLDSRVFENAFTVETPGYSDENINKYCYVGECNNSIQMQTITCVNGKMICRGQKKSNPEPGKFCYLGGCTNTQGTCENGQWICTEEPDWYKIGKELGSCALSQAFDHACPSACMAFRAIPSYWGQAGETLCNTVCLVSAAYPCTFD